MWKYTWTCTSALLSAFFNKPSKKVADFTGHRPWPLEWRDLAWAVRPTPPQNRRKGIACLWARTSSRYRLAFTSASPLIACAVSRVFWKDNPNSQTHKILKSDSSQIYIQSNAASTRWNDSVRKQILEKQIPQNPNAKNAYLEVHTKVRTSGLAGCKDT